MKVAEKLSLCHEVEEKHHTNFNSNFWFTSATVWMNLRVFT